MKLYVAPDFPAELSVPCDYLLRAKAVCAADHVAQISNLARDKISLVKHTSGEMLDGEKIRQAGLHVDRCHFGGAAMYCGTEDVTFSFHVNREALRNPDEPAGEIYARHVEAVRRALAQTGANVSVRSDPTKNRKTGVCISLEGRSEIISADGSKLSGSIYQDDGLIVTIHGIILVSDAWAKIYDYMRVPPPMARAVSLRSLVPGVSTKVVISLLRSQLGDVERATYTEQDIRTMRRLVPQFEYGRWQG